MKPILLVTLLCTATLHLPAQTPAPAAAPAAEGPKLTPEQVASIIKQLDALESTIGKNRGAILGAALARCSKAAAAGEAGALQLYLECYKLEHFDRANLKITDFQEWAKRNIDKNKDPEFLMSLWLELQYLVLTIQAQDATEKEMPGLIASLQAHIPRVVSAIQGATKHAASGAVKDAGKNGGKGGGRDFNAGSLQKSLRQSVKNSEFSLAFQLADHLKKENWTYDPGDIKGIYDQAILPYYLEKKPAELSAQWDNRIKADLTIRAAMMSESEYAAYYKEHYPEMLWHKAEYLVSHNVNTVLAMADMLKLIRENPTHPNAGDWAKTLRELVVNSQPSLLPSGSETPAAGDAPATPPN